MTGVTFADGQEVLLHRGKEYDLDETNEYVVSLLLKTGANGLPAAWLVEVAPIAAAAVVAEEEAETEEEPQQQKKKGR